MHHKSTIRAGLAYLNVLLNALIDLVEELSFCGLKLISPPLQLSLTHPVYLEPAHAFLLPEFSLPPWTCIGGDFPFPGHIWRVRLAYSGNSGGH
eukprot:755857-Hanusia_phi.AAC.2